MKMNPAKRLLAMALCLCMLFGMYVPSAGADTVSYHDMSMRELLNVNEDLTWVFTGDSITHNGGWTGGYNDYAAWFEQYLYDIGRGDDTLINTAWGGAAIDHFLPSRSGDDGMGLENFVTKYNPDVVFIKLGMNNRTMADATFVSKYNEMLDGIYAAGEANGKVPKIVLLSPTPLSGEYGISSGEFGSDPTSEDYVDSTRRFAISLSGIANERGLEFVDLRQAMVDESAVLGDRYHYTFFSDPSDGLIHPNGAGQYFMFKTICKDLGLYDAAMPIFQVSYDDITDAPLYSDSTAIDYTGNYSIDYDDVQMDKEMPELAPYNGPVLLASVDFTDENGKLDFGSSEGLRIDTATEGYAIDTLTQEEAATLDDSFSVVFRGKLNSTYNNNQPVLFISSNGTANWQNALVLGVPAKSNQLYFNCLAGKATKAGTASVGGTNVNGDGQFHTVVVTYNNGTITYYVDGVQISQITGYGLKEGYTSIGSLFENSTDFAVQIGRYGTTADGTTYKLKGDFDYWQFYKGALSDEDVAHLNENGGVQVDNGVEMDETMPQPELEPVEEKAAELLASIDFDASNGTFVGGSTYAGATRVNLTDATVMDDALTLEEVQSLEREYTLVLRARLDLSYNNNQPVLWLSNTNSSWDGSFALGAQGKGDQIYYSVKNGASQLLNTSGTMAIESTRTASDGAWHTIAYVQKTTGLEYYVDGVLKNTLAVQIKEGTTIGEVFANTTNLTAHIGSYGTHAGTYQLDADLDYYQLYKGTLTADEIKYLADHDGVSIKDQTEMDKTMPAVISDATPLASVDFDSTTGNFPYADGYTKAKLVDLTDEAVVDDALTLEEAQALEREFTIVLRGKLDSTCYRPHQALLMLTPGANSANWNNAISVGGPGTGHNFYYEVRQGGAEKTNSPNTIALKNTPTTNVRNDWHTIALVQRTDGLDYYIDGVLAETWAYKLNDGVTFGSVFADATDIMAHVGSFTKDSAGTYCLKANLDYYQLYGAALTAEQVVSLGNGSNTAAQMNATMPQLPVEEVPELLASMDFSSENGHFAGTSAYATSTRVDLTDENVVDDALTLEEVQAMGREFTIVLRGRLDSTTNRNHQPILLMNPGAESDWYNAIAVGSPGAIKDPSDGSSGHRLYYEIRKGTKDSCKEQTSSPNGINLAAATPDARDAWHTIAFVQRTDGLDYYIDGVLAQTWDYKLNDGVTIGSLFADATELTAHVGSYAVNGSGTFNLKADLDFYQFYKGALSADEIASLGSGVALTDGDQMNAAMPLLPEPEPIPQLLAAMDFDSTTGVFAGTNAYDTSTRWDLTDGSKMDDALTLEEVQAMDREFTLVLRGRLDSTTNQAHQALLMVTPGDDTDWNNAISVGGPGKSNNLYYEVRQASKESTNTNPNIIALADTTTNVTNAWHTIAIVQRTDGLDYYIDGVLAESKEYKLNSGVTLGSVFADATEITAHVGSFAKGSAPTYNLKANLDFYQLYDRALNAEQVQELSMTVNDATAEDAGWTDTVAANSVWAVVGADQMSGYLGETPNFSLFRLLNNGMRGGSADAAAYRDIRMMNLAKPGQSVAEYDAILSQHQYDVLMILPEVPDVHTAGYVHSADKVAAYKESLLALIEKNAGKPVVLWTPLASPNATINGYINDYAEAVREIAGEDPSVLAFDANKFMNERIASVGTNWFDDSMNISPLCATDLAYAFYLTADYPLYNSTKDPTNKGEILSHNLRLSSDKRLYKSGVIKENLSYGVSVSGGSFTVDGSNLAGYTNLRVAVIPALGIGSVVEPWILGDVGVSLEAPHSNPCITVYGEKDGVTYRFKDVQLTLSTDKNLTEPYFETSDLTDLQVVGAPAIGFDPSKTTYDVELYQYQRQVRIVAEGGSNLTIQVNGETVKAGQFSQYIAVEDTATVTVTVTGGAADKTYTLNLTKPEYADIIITEVMTDGYSGYTKSGADNYELIEIYNASGEDLNLLDYSIGYIREYPYASDAVENGEIPYYFTGNDQKFIGNSFLGINQITKYSSYWTDKVDQEPTEVIFPADSTMVIWVKFSKDSGTEYGSTLTYDTLINALEAHSDTHTLKIEVEENGRTYTQTILPSQDQLVVAEIPYGAAQSNVTQSIATTTENFYMDGFQVQQDYNNRRGWLFVLDDSAVRDDYGALTEAGDDIISAAKFVRPGATNKLSTVMYYDAARGMSVVKDAGKWDTSFSTGHTSDQQGYANKTTFGAIEYWQKPYDFGDHNAPILTDLTPVSFMQGEDVVFHLELADDQDVRYVELYVDADNDGTYETVIKRDITLITSTNHDGKAADVKSYIQTYTLNAQQSSVRYYGFVLDGNNNKTKLGAADAPKIINMDSDCEHSWDAGQVINEATCTKAGQMLYKCTVEGCAATRTQTLLPNGEHTWGKGEVTTEPTDEVSGVMTYTCTACGATYTEAIDSLPGVAQIGDKQYATLQAAVNAATEADVVLLTADCDETVTIGKTLNLDLNGYDVTEIIVEEGGKLYGMDSTTDDYTCGEDDYGKIGSIQGDYAPAHRIVSAGYGKRYVTVKEADAVSFHRFYVGITHMALRPGMGGAGYTMTIAGDSKVQSVLKADEAFGYAISATIGGEEKTNTYSGGKADFAGGVQKVDALTIDHILMVGEENNETYAQQAIAAEAFIHFEGMDAPITVSADSSSFQEIVLATDAQMNVESLSDEQINALCYLYNELGVGELNWEIPNITALVTNAGSTEELAASSFALMNVEVKSAARVAAQSETELFDFVGANMALDNSLAMNFAFAADHYADWSGFYAQIVKEYADGREDVTVTIPVQQWQRSGKYYLVSYNGVAAKEMADNLYVTIYNAEGNAVSVTRTDSVRDYASRTLSSKTTNAQLKTVIVDMLNYGAAAQTHFGYGTADLANSRLTEEQKALASAEVEVTDDRVKGANFIGSNLSLESNIQLNLAFNQVSEDMYAKATYIDARGNAYTVSGDLELVSGVGLVKVNALAVADYECLVDVIVYNADGSVYATASESVASYVSRSSAASDTKEELKILGQELVKFASSARSYFLGNGSDSDNNTTVLSTYVSAENGQVSQDTTFGNEAVSAQVPAGVQVESETLTLTITEKDSSDSGVELEIGERLLPLDIHIDGISAENATPIQVCLGKILPNGLNIGNVTLYHVEDGEAVAMTQVMSLAELDAHNEFYYDPATGDITVAMASFSEVAMVAETDKAWKGTIAEGFAGGTGTESDPWIIANADQLAYMSKIVSNDEAYADDHYKLISDVNLNGMEAQRKDDKNLVFYPIGYWAEQEGTNSAGEVYYGAGNSFSGVFDGNGNTISNIYQNTWLMDGDYEAGYWNTAMGLFGALWSAQIKNLTVDNFSSDGEHTPTGCIAAYAGGPGMLFENIQLTGCNPRVYNTSNGGLVGLNYNSTAGTADELIFRNITVDQTNKISALWGTYDVGCGGILGRLRENAKHDGTNTDGQKNTVTFENCHVAAIMDVHNDCCANYQYYQYRYSGMLIGTLDYIGDVPAVGVEDVVTASNTTVTYGDWNEYWYCELVKNSLASYTHDHQFSRLTEISSIDEIKSGDTWIREGNFVLPNQDNTAAECYHIFKDAEGNLYQHFHDVADETNPDIYESKDINGDGLLNDLKEDRQRYYIPFGQLWTGYGWGSSPMYAFEGVEVADGGTVKSEPKFESKNVTVVAENATITLDSLVDLIVDETKLSKSTLAVFVSPVGEDSTVSAKVAMDTNIWGNSTLTFSGTGMAKIVITDYYYCTETVLYIRVLGEGNDAIIETQIEGIDPVEIPE